MRGKSGMGGLNVGGSSLLAVFVLLCLTTFAALTMASAGADFRLTQRAMQASTEYYAADSEAEEVLALIHAVLYNVSAYPVTRGYIADAIRQLDRDVYFYPTYPGMALISYSIPLNRSGMLVVELEVEYTAARFNIVRWSLEHEPPDVTLDSGTLTLWQG